jgi:shikimate dehydrogenase
VTHGYLSGRARLAGIMGHPVGHSLSPRLHGHWLRRYGIDGAYLPLPVRPGDLEAALRALPKLGFRGCNLTIPHKQAAFRVVDRARAMATRLRAINTVFVMPDGELEGDNSDAFGFSQSLDAGVPGWRADGPATVLGAGGAARAVVAALLDAAVPSVRIANRTASHAGALADELGGPIEVVDWEERAGALEGASLLVNATSLGMGGQAPLELPLDRLPARGVVVDIVYTPLETPLLRVARQRGHRTVDGLGMLLHQGRLGFRHWFGVDPEVDDELRGVVLAGLG